MTEDNSNQEKTISDDNGGRKETVVGNFAHNIEGYEMLEELGRGGMGIVYKARQVSLDRLVAIKVLPEDLAADESFVKRFNKEAQVLATLNHPNIVSIHDKGKIGNTYYFTMEFIEGTDLRSILKKLSPPEAMKIVSIIADALEYAHKRGVIHRDIKPENILIDKDNNIKIADFGLVGLLEGGHAFSNLTATNVMMGTVNYMAPEQRKDAKNVDHRADIYSLGVMLYEMLTGEVPIGGFKLPSRLNPKVDVRIDGIVAKTLESDPGERYQRVSEISSAISEITGQSEKKKLPAKKLIFVLLVLAACLAVFAYVLNNNKKVSPEEKQKIAMLNKQIEELTKKIEDKNVDAKSPPGKQKEIEELKEKVVELKKEKEISLKKPVKIAPVLPDKIIDPMDAPENWKPFVGAYSKVETSSVNGRVGNALRVSYNLSNNGPFVQITEQIDIDLSRREGIEFFFKGDGNSNTLELKLVDEDGTTFWKVHPEITGKKEWVEVKVPFKEMANFAFGTNIYGGDAQLDLKNIRYIIFAVSKKDSDFGGSGFVEIDELKCYGTVPVSASAKTGKKSEFKTFTKKFLKRNDNARDVMFGFPNNFVYKNIGDIRFVQIAGTFNDWLGGKDKTVGDTYKYRMKKWWGTDLYLKVQLSPGSYRYKFVVNGEKWLQDKNNKEVSDDGLNSVMTVTPAAVNTIPGVREVFASSDQNITECPSGVAAAIDGSRKSRWGSAWMEDPSWLIIRFKEKRKFKSVTIHWETAQARTYSICASNDNQNWTVVKRVAVIAPGESIKTNFPELEEKFEYWMISCESRMTYWGYSIWEIEFLE